ncbi:MAG TPA: hypothetical protein VHY08_20725, partial [Bacillota bacterium]|nr:hypothetical protein [Bacillota bacterium]
GETINERRVNMYTDKINEILTGTLISDEKHKDAGTKVFCLNHDTFWGGSDLEIWTGSNKTGTQLIQDTDYILGNEDINLSDSSEKAVYTTVNVINASFQSGTLYFTYYTLGDYTQAKDINDVNHSLNTGWVDPREIWTYESTGAFKVDGDITSRNQKGDKVKFTQSKAYTNTPSSGANIVLNMADTSGFKIGNTVWVSSSAGSEQTAITAINSGVSITVANLALNHTATNPLVSCVKYAYITGVSYTAPNSTVTINMGADYGFANATITDNYYSKIENPQGFPDWFNYTPSLSGFSANPSNSVYRFCVKGKSCVVEFRQGTAGTSNGTGFTATAPVISANISNAVWGNMWWSADDNGTAQTSPGRVSIGSNTNIITIDKNTAGAVWTGSGNKRASFTLIYEI